MIYQHPLAYLLGLQGAALLRAFNSECGRDFTYARLAEIRALLESAGEFGGGVTTGPVTTAAGYDAWAERYDEPTDLVQMEKPVVRQILAGLPAGAALDAALRNRPSRRLSGRPRSRGDRRRRLAGDLAVARAKVPDGDFRDGDLRRLPAPDAEVDLGVCALALTHVPDLAPASPSSPGCCGPAAIW